MNSSTSFGSCTSAHHAHWARVRGLPELAGWPDDPPAAWAFGATPAHADELLGLVLSGVKTGTASSLWDYEHAGDPIPEVGELSIILDGRGAPRAVFETTAVRVVPFGDVDADHAWSEGEGDRSLTAWREIHERYWRAHSESPRGFAPDMPVVCERFRLIA
ncbi:ASCH domain-containing protein [Microbacterium lacticum]